MTHPASIGRYTVLGEIGRGGMGTVYQAVDPSIDRRVAIKLLRRDVVTENPEVLERLWVEARAANRIGHAGVVQVSEVATLEDGTGYLVMEYLEGQTLSQKLRERGGRLPVQEALKYAVQVASTLSAGHLKDVVHRDLKPSNVMLVPDDAVPGGERVKLLDFGIAKIACLGVASGLTQTNVSMGTPGYMAPEQLRDAARADERSDVYALGAVLYEMLAGRPPHVAPSSADLIAAVLTAEAPPITHFEPDVPPAIERLLGQMLRRQASERPTMTEALRELVLRSAPASGHAHLPKSGAPEAPSTSVNRKLPTAPPTQAGAEPASASTPSQIAGQRPLKEALIKSPTSPSWKRAVYVGVLFGAIGFGAWLVHRGAPPQNTPQPAASPSRPPEPPALPSPPTSPSPPPPPSQPPVKPVPVPDPNPPPAPRMGKIQTPPSAPRPSQGFAKVTPGCLRPLSLPPAIKQAVTSAASSAGVRVTPSQALSLQRQGERGFVFAAEYEKHLSGQMRSEFEIILRQKLHGISIPPGLHRITIQCGR